MTTATQQLPSNPALEFAQSILEVTNNGLELIEMLNEIAEGDDEGATTNDRITAASILTERAFGKSPRQISHSAGLNPELAPATDGDSPKAKKEADSPRLVTRIDDALNQSLGSAPGASHHTKQPAPTTDSLESPDPFDPNSIHFTIQQHILDITNNGKTLRDTLLEIARACPEPVEGSKGRRVEGSLPTTGAGPYPSCWTAPWAQTPTLSGARSAPAADKAGQPTPVHPFILSNVMPRRARGCTSGSNCGACPERVDSMRRADQIKTELSIGAQCPFLSMVRESCDDIIGDTPINGVIPFRRLPTVATPSVSTRLL